MAIMALPISLGHHYRSRHPDHGPFRRDSQREHCTVGMQVECEDTELRSGQVHFQASSMTKADFD